MNNAEKCKLAVDYGYSFIGWKYIWGGEGAHSGGFDCSGFVLECLRSVGLWGASDASASGIFTSLVGKSSIVDAARKGDLLFFGESRQKITHIAWALNDWQMLEFGGGGSDSKSGMGRIRPIAWRKDLCAIMRLK